MLQLELDVTDEQACTDAVRRTREELGGLDILVNNAGVMLLGTIVGADTEDWRRMLHTNVLGLMYMTHAAIEGMVEQGSGDIVNISSVAGRVARLGSGRLQRQQVGGERVQRVAAPGGDRPRACASRWSSPARSRPS